MDRRELLGTLAGGLLVIPRIADAQAVSRIHRIGFLRNGPPPETFLRGFRQGLSDLGYIEGTGFIIEFGLAQSPNQLEQTVADLVRRRVDVLIASGTPPTAAAARATKTIPIVFIASIDPVATGLVASLARPGGNITGFAGTHADLMGKRLELLKETIPRLARVGLFSHAANPGNVEYVSQAKSAAQTLGLELKVLAVRDAGDFDRVFVEAKGVDALIQLDDVLFTSRRRELVELAVRRQIPVMYGFREFVEAGGFLAYGPDYPDLYRRAATYVDKILKGAKPADLPIEQPTKFELTINRKTSRVLGLTIPPSLLARADQVIE